MIEQYPTSQTSPELDKVIAQTLRDEGEPWLAEAWTNFNELGPDWEGDARQLAIRVRKALVRAHDVTAYTGLAECCNWAFHPDTSFPCRKCGQMGFAHRGLCEECDEQEMQSDLRYGG